MQDHCSYVWNKFVKKSPAKQIFIVAHSAGGYCTSVLLDENCKIES